MKVTISAQFPNKSAYLACLPDKVTYFYAHDGQPLTEEHADKMESILAFHVDNGIDPIFLLNERIVDENQPCEAEAQIDLNLWTNDGEPRYTMRDIKTGEVLAESSGNRGGRPRKTSLKTSL
jgi:hypothetical protein